MDGFHKPIEEKLMSNVVARIEQEKIVAVIRGDDPGLLLDAAESLIQGGVSVLEVTFTVPRALWLLEQLAHQLGDRALLGAGTVLDVETGRAALLAGARFLVSPTVNPAVARLGQRYGAAVMLGALTPTEILKAWESGSQIVKVFPADVGGPAYLKAIRGPLPQVKLMPTGGIDLNNSAEFIKAGACALGVGGALVSRSLLERRAWDELTARAQAYVKAVGRSPETLESRES